MGGGGGGSRPHPLCSTLLRVPTPQGKWQNKSLSGKAQGIWFAQVVNNLILKVKYISIFQED